MNPSLLKNQATCCRATNAGGLPFVSPLFITNSVCWARFEAIIEFMRELLSCDNPEVALAESIEQIKKVVVLAPSSKHLNHRTLDRLESSASLKYKKVA